MENLDTRIDARALETYAQNHGISTLDMTKEERIAFLLPRTKDEKQENIWQDKGKM